VGVLRAIPRGRLDYRPDPKARTATELAWLLATAKAALVSLLDTGIVQWKEQAPPAENDRIVAVFERDVAAVNQRRERLDEAGGQK
jgi:3-mercaptopyruvate sulfurtransferase SseA